MPWGAVIRESARDQFFWQENVSRLFSARLAFVDFPEEPPP